MSNEIKRLSDEKSIAIMLSDNALDDRLSKAYQNFYLVKLENHVEKKLSKGISKTQMRSIFELFRDCKSNDEMKQLKPRLMYTAGRLSGKGKFFILDLIKISQKLRKENDFKKVYKLIEAILAYHKYHCKK